VVYLIFNEGYSASGGDELQRQDLVDDALRLGRTLQQLLPDDPEVAGLLALMLLIDARRAARNGADGMLVRLKDQDRALWDRARIDEGQALLRACLARNHPGPYQLQAAINAVHSDAREARDTDWRQILAIYDQLMTLMPNAVVAMNRAVAVAELEGPEMAMRLVDELDLERYHLWHAVRADLLRRMGRLEEAESSYTLAIGRCANGAEKDFLERRRLEVRRRG
jgi:RNA polymerase sigma-70 factor (ECF subfamily)